MIVGIYVSYVGVWLVIIRVSYTGIHMIYIYFCFICWNTVNCVCLFRMFGYMLVFMFRMMR